MKNSLITLIQSICAHLNLGAKATKNGSLDLLSEIKAHLEHLKSTPFLGVQVINGDLAFANLGNFHQIAGEAVKAMRVRMAGLPKKERKYFADRIKYLDEWMQASKKLELISPAQLKQYNLASATDLKLEDYDLKNGKAVETQVRGEEQVEE